MRVAFAGLMVLGLSVAARAGDEPPAKVPTDFKTLKKEYDDAKADLAKFQEEALSAAQKKFEAAKTDAERNEIKKNLAASVKDEVSPKFSPRFLEFAQTHPKDPAAFEAFHWLCRRAADRNRRRARGPALSPLCGAAM